MTEPNGPIAAALAGGPIGDPLNECCDFCGEAFTDADARAEITKKHASTAEHEMGLAHAIVHAEPCATTAINTHNWEIA